MQSQIFICFTVLVSALALQTQKPCRLREFERGYVCVCDDDYCDSLDVPLPESSEYILVTSSSQGDRFAYKRGKLCKQNQSNKNKRSNGSKPILEIDSTKTYQTIRGFGGGYPGAVTYLVNKLSPKMRECFYKSYFSSDVGMSYSVIRIPIGGCDFELEPWAYNEYPENDAHLSNFTKLDDRDLARNKQFKEMAQISGNQNINILSAAWSPPRWMKQKHQWYGLKNNTIKPEYYQTWANYHKIWLDLMANDGIDIWALSTGNEPSSAQLNYFFQETYWNASEQAIWIAEHFGPTIKNSKYANIDIHGFDDSRLFFAEWLDGMRNGSEKAFDYISTISFHGYFDAKTKPEMLDEVQNKFPDKRIWFSEMCFGIEFFKEDPGPQLGLWSRAEELTNLLMKAFKHSTVGYIDWNLMLNHTGGPCYVSGTTDAPVILSENFKEMYKQPMFYVMAHFSKFISPGSIRINVQLTGEQASAINALAFSRPDKKIVVILYNNDANTTVALEIRDKITGTMKIKLKPKSINSLIYNVENEDLHNFRNLFNIFIIPSIWN